jgi:hypothetical protein
MIQELGSVHRGLRIAFLHASSHTGLQIADYCSWVVQRHLEQPTDSQAIEFKELMQSRLVNLYLPFDGK